MQRFTTLASAIPSDTAYSAEGGLTLKVVNDHYLARFEHYSRDVFSVSKHHGSTTFLVGVRISHVGSIGAPVAVTSVAFALGLLVIPFTRETMGQALR